MFVNKQLTTTANQKQFLILEYDGSLIDKNINDILRGNVQNQVHYSLRMANLYQRTCSGAASYNTKLPTGCELYTMILEIFSIINNSRWKETAKIKSLKVKFEQIFTTANI